MRISQKIALEIWYLGYTATSEDMAGIPYWVGICILQGIWPMRLLSNDHATYIWSWLIFGKGKKGLKPRLGARTHTSQFCLVDFTMILFHSLFPNMLRLIIHFYHHTWSIPFERGTKQVCIVERSIFLSHRFLRKKWPSNTYIIIIVLQYLHICIHISQANMISLAKASPPFWVNFKNGQSHISTYPQNQLQSLRGSCFMGPLSAAVGATLTSALVCHLGSLGEEAKQLKWSLCIDPRPVFPTS